MNLGNIKVPERIARFSACIGFSIYRILFFFYVQAKNRLLYSTDVFTHRSEEVVDAVTTDVRLKDHMHRVRKSSNS